MIQNINAHSLFSDTLEATEGTSNIKNLSTPTKSNAKAYEFVTENAGFCATAAITCAVKCVQGRHFKRYEYAEDSKQVSQRAVDQEFLKDIEEVSSIAIVGAAGGVDCYTTLNTTQ